MIRQQHRQHGLLAIPNDYKEFPRNKQRLHHCHYRYYCSVSIVFVVIVFGIIVIVSPSTPYYVDAFTALENPSSWLMTKQSCRLIVPIYNKNARHTISRSSSDCYLFSKVNHYHDRLRRNMVDMHSISSMQYNTIRLASSIMNENDNTANSNMTSTSSTTTTSSGNWFKRIQQLYITDNKNNDEKKLSTKEKLAKMGIAAVLSYGWVSNMSYSVTVSMAWYIFSKRTGLSPLAPGQWKGFLTVYAGFWVFNNIVRPIRVAVAIGISSIFDTIVLNIQTKLKVNKPTAITITVFLANVVGTISFMSLGIVLASILTGVPIFPPPTIIMK